MKGLVFHWDSPWKDIYSGLDPLADAWIALAKTFDLELHTIETYWPFPERYEVYRWPSLKDFVETHASETSVVLADYREGDKNITNQNLADPSLYLVFGPTDGWSPDYDHYWRWTYKPSPPNGFHAVHLAHIACHIGRG